MINWGALVMQIVQLVAGAALVATQHDPNLQNLGTVLIGSGIGQSFPQGISRKP